MNRFMRKDYCDDCLLDTVEYRKKEPVDEQENKEEKQVKSRNRIIFNPETGEYEGARWEDIMSASVLETEYNYGKVHR